MSKSAPINHPDANRLIIEIASIYVACDDCGHTRMLYLPSLKTAGDLGVHTYAQLCRKIRCGECPRQPLSARNLTIRPTWKCDVVVQTVA